MFGGYIKDKAYASKLASLKLKGENIGSYSCNYPVYNGMYVDIDNFRLNVCWAINGVHVITNLI
jgi:hypothetical protein